MGKKDPRIDAYIAKSAGFARPILSSVRGTVHAACPGVEETIKWGFPHFMYHGMLCSMAAFKQHCALHFWRGGEVLGDTGRAGEAMGQFGRIQSREDLPSKAMLAGYVRKAMARNEARAETPRPVKRVAKPLRVPADLAAALKTHRKARATFEGFPPGHRREYIEWITGAKREETRARRLATTIEWLTEGKPHNWKYMSRAGTRSE